MKTHFIKVMFDEEDKKAIEDYLEETYKGNMSDFFRRLAFEKVRPWQAQKREEERREAEHQARLNAIKNGTLKDN